MYISMKHRCILKEAWISAQVTSLFVEVDYDKMFAQTFDLLMQINSLSTFWSKVRRNFVLKNIWFHFIVRLISSQLNAWVELVYHIRFKLNMMHNKSKFKFLYLLGWCLSYWTAAMFWNKLGKNCSSIELQIQIQFDPILDFGRWIN